LADNIVSGVAEINLVGYTEVYKMFR